VFFVIRFAYIDACFVSRPPIIDTGKGLEFL